MGRMTVQLDIRGKLGDPAVVDVKNAAMVEVTVRITTPRDKTTLPTRQLKAMRSREENEGEKHGGDLEMMESSHHTTQDCLFAT